MSFHRKDGRCYQGHLVEGDNAYVSKRGYLICKECKKIARSHNRRLGRDRTQWTRAQLHAENRRLMLLLLFAVRSKHTA